MYQLFNNNNGMRQTDDNPRFIQSMFVFSVAWLILLFGGLASVEAADDYRLGGGDSVNISVYGQPDLTTAARISQDDGTITFPLIGEVAVAGLSAEEAGRKIEQLLKSGGYLKSPQVSLKVQAFDSQKVPIMGQVNKPGEYLLKGEARVADLITQAGGLRQDAADIIVVVKNENGKSVKHQVDILRFYEGDMSQNIAVSSGDFILVPKMDTFYIHGEVKRPGSYRLERGMTVVQALSVGGGVTGRGSLKGIKVTRKDASGATHKVDVELSDLLEPNDVVYVKERLF